MLKQKLEYILKIDAFTLCNNIFARINHTGTLGVPQVFAEDPDSTQTAVTITY